MRLIQTFNAPITGYFDGSHKEFSWTIEKYNSGMDARGSFVRIGSWTANHWFYVSKGKTDKQTLANARRRLGAAAKKAGQICSFSYEE